jgi:acyl carrier protein
MVATTDRLHFSPVVVREAIERSLLDEVRKLLPRQQIDASENLSDRGLSSVDFLQLLTYIQAQFDCELTLNEIWTSQSVHAIAALVSRKRAAQNSPGRADIAAIKDAGSNRWLAAPQQQRFWRVHRPTETRFSEVVTSTISLSDGIDRNLVQKAIDHVYSRHDSLRTLFTLEQGELWAVHQEGSIGVEELDLRTTPSPAGLESILRAEAARIYDVTNGPLVRCQFVRGPDVRNFLVCNLYHLICDGVSKQILKRDLILALRSYARNKSPSLRKPDWSYAQYSAWSNWLRKQPAFFSARAYWREVFKPNFIPFHLSDRSQTKLDAAAFGYIFRLDARMSRAIGEYARRCRTTEFIILLSAFLRYLSSWAGNREITVGVPTNGRTHPSVRHTLGLFSNSLLMRYSAAPTMNFAETISSTHKQMMSAQQHQIYQYDEIARDLELPFEIERFPITGVYFNNISHDLAAGPSGSADDHFYECGGSVKYDLLANYKKDEEHIAFNLEHRKSAFSEADIRAFAAGFKTHLAAAIADASRP